ncbi:hypothetical protein PSET11_00150 [Arthrobacter ulcerisalmonis]|uniref:Uncharacterized protein n=2 Tax=Arthrobacter ulcerisalmonis TaxID=2483813 RepID=A0A3P5W9N6_9MICC|nr:hypothetical protein [Arthrobacter ulcerisalmonis]VDC18284.1 hypothetical protein PSET11_00150 [Arthrobacter ulcerisalmonis]
MHPKIATSIDPKLLQIYLTDHLAGATAGRDRSANMAHRYQGRPMGSALVKLAGQINDEHQTLAALIEALGFRRRLGHQVLAGLGEKLGRLKLNGRILSTSPLTPVIEIELMRSAVVGKIGLWRTLRDLSPQLELEQSKFQDLEDLARQQLGTLDDLHAQQRTIGFSTKPPEK